MPTAFTLLAAAHHHAGAQLLAFYYFGFRHQQCKAQFVAQGFQVVGDLCRCCNAHFGLQRRAYRFIGTQRFNRGGHRITRLAHRLPFLHQPRFAFRVHGREIVQGVEQHAVFLAAANQVPRFFGGETQNRRHQQHQAAGDVVQRGLRTAAGVAVGFGGIETVFQNIQIERAQIFRAEIHNVLHRKVEGIARVIIARQLFLQTARQHHRIAVDFHHIGLRHSVFQRIKIAEVGQQEAQSVAQTAVAFGYPFQNFLGNRQLAGIIGGRCPQAQNIGAKFVVHLLRRHHVAD